MVDAPTSDWDPRAPSVLRDQRRAYDEMRERCPVAYSDFLNWSLFRHSDIVAVLADPATYSSASRHRAIPNGMDPPEHSLYRRALEPFFDSASMAAFEPRCRSIAIDQVESLLKCAEVEFVTAFAQPFSFKSLCAFLDWPLAKWERLHGWAHGNQEASLSPGRAAGAALAHEFANVVEDELRRRRAADAVASTDITATLMQTVVDDSPLNDEDIVSVLRNWTAGHGTVAAALGIVLLFLAQHSDVQQRLRSEPDLLPAAINEILRTDGPLVANRRTTTREVEINGRTIAAGERISLNWIAADRDGRAFDDPETARIDRNPAGNLLFGAGIHDCVGAPLAILEMRVAMEELLRRTTEIRLGVSEPQRAVFPSNGLLELPLRIR